MQAARSEHGVGIVRVFSKRRVMSVDPAEADGLDKVYFSTHNGAGGYLPRHFLVDGMDYWRMPRIDPGYPTKLAAGGTHAFNFPIGDDFAVWRKKGRTPVLTLKLLTDAGIKLTIGMGNHDHHSSFFEVWPEYVKRTLVPGQVVCTVNFPHADLVMIDSLNETAKPGEWNPVPGGFSKAMEEWVVESLPKWKRPFFVGAHHGFWELSYGAKKTKLCKLLCKCPNFRGYIHGHDHFWNTGVVDWHVRTTRPFMTLPSSGLWGDIGYVTFRIGPDKAVAHLVEEDFFQPSPCAPEERNPYWDTRIADLQGRTCTFAV